MCFALFVVAALRGLRVAVGAAVSYARVYLFLPVGLVLLLVRVGVLGAILVVVIAVVMLEVACVCVLFVLLCLVLCFVVSLRRVVLVRVVGKCQVLF